MAPTDIRPKGYGGGLPSFVIPPGEKGIERRRRLAEVLAQQGTSTEPVQSWTQGAARVAQSLAGVLGNYQANQMEQQRSSALAEAMRSGATAEQLFATGDEQLMEIAKFKLQQDQQRLDSERQAKLLELQLREDARDQARAAREARPKFTPYGQPAPTAQPGQPAPSGQPNQYEGAIGVDENGLPVYAEKPPISPYDTKRQQQQAESDVDAAARVKAAQAFKAKVGRVRQSFAKSKPVIDANGQPVDEEFESGDDSLFGIVQSDPRYRAAANFLGDVFETSEPKRSALDALYSDLELDVAQMKMAKQGPVTENERLIARKTLGGLSNPDARTAWDILRQQEREADAIIAGGGGKPKLEVPITTPRGQPRQHPIQGAPPPQPNVRAGQVPVPSQAGIPPMPTDDPRLTPDIWARMSPEERVLWMQSQ